MDEPDKAVSPREDAVPDFLSVAPAAAARQLRGFFSAVDRHPALGRWVRDLATCYLAQMMIDDFSPEMKKTLKTFGITIPDV